MGSPRLPRIAVTMGDPAGVGPEICLRLLAAREMQQICHVIVFGDADVLEHASRQCHLPFPDQVFPAAAWDEAFEHIDTPSILDLSHLAPSSLQPGIVSAENGAASFTYVGEAIRAALKKQVQAITTAPINKESMHAAGVPFPGHTEILASLTNAERVCMMLTSDEITCSLVTAHVGLREVPGLLSVSKIVDAIELTAETLRKLRGREPRLVACGLNPHAGEGGLFGEREEEQLIVPALDKARAAGIHIDGPIPPDTAFLPARRSKTDGYICMYHDQGLIPLKMLSFETAINITLGLPIIRTSVDHGTAFDIAWQGVASPTSLFEATKLAARLAGVEMQSE